ncbi:MAG: hypothetical protein QOF83_1407 [Solirubrobacteraceae bacterium]|nr:hypothetical protein [Solirubrobacteraceae bacterium]
MIRRGRVVVQRRVDRGGLATDQDPQPGDFQGKVRVSVGAHSRIVSLRRTRVKVSRRRVFSDAPGAGRVARARLCRGHRRDGLGTAKGP